jgi:hypothetical protein
MMGRSIADILFDARVEWRVLTRSELHQVRDSMLVQGLGVEDTDGLLWWLQVDAEPRPPLRAKPAGYRRLPNPTDGKGG